MDELLYRHPRVPYGINLFLSLVLLFFLLLFARDILSGFSQKREKASVPPRVRLQPPKRGLQEYAGILKSNPFGFAGGQLKELSVAKEGSVAQSDITLIGTISGSARNSYGIFMDKSGKQELVKVGEPVFGLGKLKRVESERAYVSEQGREVKIPMAEILTIKEVNPSPGGGTASDIARSVGKGMFLVDQKKILHALENPNELMTDARLQPNLVNGKQEGYILREVRNGGIYQSLGLQNGDALLRINEYNISNPENALQAFTALRGMDRVQVDIVRDGAKMTLTYQIR
ncbi:MAG TPA: type II secretion system protein N [Thermodesulfovibrionales bacterium]|nr:type II secretion system protein N [Thermodesulfovibrionales bacterium]